MTGSGSGDTSSQPKQQGGGLSIRCVDPAKVQVRKTLQRTVYKTKLNNYFGISMGRSGTCGFLKIFVLYTLRCALVQYDYTLFSPENPEIAEKYHKSNITNMSSLLRKR